jgi:hypothetical protein
MNVTYEDGVEILRMVVKDDFCTSNDEKVDMLRTSATSP